MYIQTSPRESICQTGQNQTTEIFASNGFSARISSALIAFFDGIVDAIDRRRAQDQLQALSDRALTDIGISRADIETLPHNKACR